MHVRKRHAMRRIYCVSCLSLTLALLVLAAAFSESATAREIFILDSSGPEASSFTSYRKSIYPTSTATASSNSTGLSTGTTALKTDPEQERRLQRAVEFAKRGRYDLAVVLWQAVLNESTDSVMTRDDWKFETSRHAYQKYRSMADEVERTLATLPKNGLELYRLRADGEAKALLAGAKGDDRERALSQVVRKYFVSKLGDDAAFELACRKMDRGEFIGASRLLEKVLTDYPDSDIGRDELLRRLAVAQARVGDFDAAYKALAGLKKNPGDSRALIEMIEADLKSSATVTVQQDASTASWPITLGGAGRNSHMKAPSTVRTGSGLTELWSHPIDIGLIAKGGTKTGTSTGPGTGPKVIYPASSYGSGGYRGSVVISRSSSFTSPYSPYGQPYSPTIAPVTSDEQLIQRWKQYGWKPAGRVLIDGSRIYFKSRTRLVCLDSDTNRVLWKSLWVNSYAPDPAFLQLAAVSSNTNRPRNPFDVQLFGDVVHQAMSLANGRVFSVEGPHPSTHKESKPATPKPVVRTITPYGYGTVPSYQRSRTNFLTAYDAKTGKLLWHRAAGVSDKEKEQAKVGFVGSPVPYASLLIAPVADNGEVWVYGLSQKTGETLWKSKLCDEPQGGAAAWSPTMLSVDGGEAYVGTGAGVIFALDAMTGSVRWAFRYPRTGRQNYNRRYGYGQPNIKMLIPVGMDEDIVIPHGRSLVVMASDHDVVFAIDRRSGKFLWDSPLYLQDEPEVDYCVGVYKNGLYLAGKQSIRRYDMRGGALNWVKKFKTSDDSEPASLGRAVVTDDGVYVPVKDSILKLAHKDGNELGQIGVVLTGRAPVGNLYSDGERMFVLNPNRISALGDVKVRLKALDAKVKAGDLTAHLERMRIRGRLKNMKGALDDLRAIVKRLGAEKTGKTNERTMNVLLASIKDLRLASVEPVETLKLLAGTRRIGGISVIMANSTVVDPVGSEREEQVRVALLEIRKQKLKPAVPVVLDAARLYTTFFLQKTARLAVRDLAGKADIDRLLKAMDGKDVVLRRLAVAGLARQDDKRIGPALQSALKEKDENLRMEAAVALCNRIDHSGLPALAELLKSKEIQTRIRASRFLRKITGKRFGFVAYESESKRTAAIAKWSKWISTDGQSAALTPVAEDKTLRGLTLTANQSNNLVIEYDSNGHISKRISVSNPSAVLGLENGHRLVASSSRNQIIEYDRDWNVVKTTSTSSYGQPYSLRLLDNGHVLVAMYNGRRVVEFDRNHRVVWQASVPGNASDAHRLSNGNTLVCLYGGVSYRGSSIRSSSSLRTRTSYRLVEVNKSGGLVKSYDNVTRPWTASQLENGNILVVQYSIGRVTEFDAKQKKVWEKSGLSNPLHAQRLPDGNTLIVHRRGVSEYDASGKEVWRKIGSNVRWVHRY